MAILNTLVPEHLDQWKHGFHIVKALLEIFVGWILFAVGRQAQAVLLEQINAVFHADNLVCDV